jgi:hypothetical protein
VGPSLPQTMTSLGGLLFCSGNEQIWVETGEVKHQRCRRSWQTLLIDYYFVQGGNKPAKKLYSPTPLQLGRAIHPTPDQ